MSEPSVIGYQRDKVRITASYTPAKAGDDPVPGQPETVEIELNEDAVPADDAERVVFLTALIDSLFRGEARPAANSITVTGPKAVGELPSVAKLAGDARRRGTR